MTMTRLGRGIGVVMTVLAVVGIPSMSAFADSSTCYPSCSPPTTVGTGSGGGGGTSGGGGPSPVTGPGGSGGSGSHTGSGSRSGSGSGSLSGSGSGTQTAVSTKSSGSGLPFTGADIEEMTAIGAGALLVGGILVRRGRQRRRAGA